MNYLIPDSYAWVVKMLCTIIMLSPIIVLGIGLIMGNRTDRMESNGTLYVTTDMQDGSRYLFLELEEDLGKLNDGQKVTFTVKNRSQ